eukprot:361895-Chlamydomonas_euryale.AAC.3
MGPATRLGDGDARCCLLTGWTVFWAGRGLGSNRAVSVFRAHAHFPVDWTWMARVTSTLTMGSLSSTRLILGCTRFVVALSSGCTAKICI